MTEADGRERTLRDALAMERRFSMMFGGYAVELPEAHLVVNEKIPAPRFNWVQDVRCSPMRVTAFLERTLDHYFSRALRPTFEVRTSPPHEALGHALALSHFEPLGADHRRHLLLWTPSGSAERLLPEPDDLPGAVPASSEEFGTFADLFVLPRQRQEIIRCLEVAEAHPNPGERTAVYLTPGPTGPLSSALYVRHGSWAGLFAVGTRPGARSQGRASALVAAVLRREALQDRVPVVLSSEGKEPPAPLLRLGFALLESFDVYAVSEGGSRRGF